MTFRTISRTLIQDLETKAESSARLRTNHNFHESGDALVQRLLIQLRRGTYIRPHRHFELNKWEMTLVIAGEVEIVLFADDGTLRERLHVGAGGDILGLELPPDTWHSYVPLTTQATFFEIKEGPYDAARMSQFAPWSPAEGEVQVPAYLDWMENGAPGSRFSG
jgi:cupin fold WbuC family metalloprotein